LQEWDDSGISTTTGESVLPDCPKTPDTTSSKAFVSPKELPKRQEVTPSSRIEGVVLPALVGSGNQGFLEQGEMATLVRSWYVVAAD
jgi:hypothetical protein